MGQGIAAGHRAGNRGLRLGQLVVIRRWCYLHQHEVLCRGAEIVGHGQGRGEAACRRIAVGRALLDGAVAVAKVNSQIYVANRPVDFSMKAAIVYQDMKFRIKDSDFLLGAALSYLNAENTFGFGLPDPNPDVLNEERFALDFNNVGLAGKIVYETRDNTMNPRSGQIIELSLWRYDEAIGGDYDYWSAKLKALSFHSLTEKLTLGLRLEVSGVDGRVPFFAIPFVSLRGVPALRYQNKTAGAAEVELRYRIRPKWEASVFGGVGFTSDAYPIFENPDSIYNFGVGGRYNIFEAHNVWVGLDIARGPEDWNWYVQVGHPW